jgi:hypothetical protein
MFQWPLQKIDLINSALSQTGDNLVAAADDGSDEWNTCSPAYERALAVVTEAHPWGWATDTRQIQPAANPPDDHTYQLAYNIPTDLVHLILVTLDRRKCLWDLQNNQIYLKAHGFGWTFDPETQAETFNGAPGFVTIKGIFAENSDTTFGTPTVILALQHFVMSGIYRGLHEDTAEAAKMMALGNQILEAAKSRHDMQKPKRAMFNSRISASRRIRRPWPPVPGGWGSNGIPD